jgi:PPOX class probable F420-dependent enzyme
MARAMSDDEWRQFVMHGTRTGKLATVRADGSANVVPIWFVLDDDGAFVFNTGAESAKGKAMRRDPRVALLVDDQQPPYSFVLARGEVTLTHDVDAMLPWATRIGGRYMGEERAEEFGRRNAVPEERLVRLVPTTLIALAGVAD